MIKVYNDQDLLAVYKQRKKMLGIFGGITAAYAAFCISWWLYFMSLPYNDSRQNLPQALVFIVTAVYLASLFPLMGIKYSRINRYYKALNNFSLGLKNAEKNYFYMFEEHSLQKDNIDVTYCVFEAWNKKKQEWQERQVYFDSEKELPDLQSGDLVQYIVQSNFILQYEVLERGVFKFEEEEENQLTEEIEEA